MVCNNCVRQNTSCWWTLIIIAVIVVWLNCGISFGGSCGGGCGGGCGGCGFAPANNCNSCPEF